MRAQYFFLVGFLAGEMAFVRPVVAHKLGTGSGSGGWNKQPSAKGKGIFKDTSCIGCPKRGFNLLRIPPRGASPG